MYIPLGCVNVSVLQILISYKMFIALQCVLLFLLSSGLDVRFFVVPLYLIL
jgi:hypothetical protein